jgi:hypothetical protein
MFDRVWMNRGWKGEVACVVRVSVVQDTRGRGDETKRRMNNFSSAEPICQCRTRVPP